MAWPCWLGRARLRWRARATVERGGQVAGGICWATRVAATGSAAGGTAGALAAVRGGGREGRAGGWGYLLGDEGSGYWLGREAIAVLLRALEGRDSTGALVDLVRAAPGRGVQSVPAVIAWVNSGSGQV